MYKNEVRLRVRYAETDQMGFVYYGKYAEYFEVARVECLRTLGIEYKKLEDQGIWLPVVNYSVQFFKPATYDDELFIVTSITAPPTVRIAFSYECRNAIDERIATATTDLVFLDAEKRKPIRCPEEIARTLAPYFK